MVAVLLLVFSVVIFLSIAVSRLAEKLKIPVLLGFIALGLFVGNDVGIGPEFDNFALTESICTAALVIVMFDGGFQTRWKAARPAALQAGLLASLGVVITAALTGVFCVFVLHMSWLEGLLLGSLVSSTDAASVFSILRSRHLSLKDHSDSLLEVESGSNDPFSYLLVSVLLTMMGRPMSPAEIILVLLLQIGLGLAAGWLTGRFSVWFFQHVPMETSGFQTVFVFGCSLLAYGGATLLSGNGYLAVYLAGLMIGNSRLPDKKKLVHFFDGLSAMMQMLIFFILGLLADPSDIIRVLPVSFGVFLFLSLVSRPAAVFGVLSFFGSSLRKMLLVSAAGLRGAASIVFAIMAMTHPVLLRSDVFSIVFGVVLFSISVQGTLLPWFSRVLKMTSGNDTVLKTFNDYSEEPDLQFSLLELEPGSRWANRTLAELGFPAGMAAALLLRKGERILPKGSTRLQDGDQLVITSQPYLSGKTLLNSKVIEPGDPRIGHSLLEIHTDPIVCISRDQKMIVPNGSTTLQEQDVLIYVEPKTIDTGSRKKVSDPQKTVQVKLQSEKPD